MTRAISIAPVRKSITVEASPARAFEVFTSGIDRWWPRTHSLGSEPVKRSIIEPFVGGRWYAVGESGAVDSLQKGAVGGASSSSIVTSSAWRRAGRRCATMSRADGPACSNCLQSSSHRRARYRVAADRRTIDR
jgi:hypothetical protein